ncbi:MAG: cbb3-type cytochrome oxidase assembly protein CcoS [Planctomycetota bacterium]
MGMYLLLTSAGLLLFLVALAFAIWLVRHGQFDDLDTPALRMLHDPDERSPDQAGPPATRDPA